VRRSSIPIFHTFRRRRSLAAIVDLLQRLQS
jgi:hypothetical protein